jgi:hypothetical protein
LEAPSERIRFCASLFTFSRPSTTLISTGKKQMPAAIATFEAIPSPNQLRKTGASAIRGTISTATTSGKIARRTAGNRPMAVPIRYAASTPKMKPSNASCAVTHAASQKK